MPTPHPLERCESVFRMSDSASMWTIHAGESKTPSKKRDLGLGCKLGRAPWSDALQHILHHHTSEQKYKEKDND